MKTILAVICFLMSFIIFGCSNSPTDSGDTNTLVVEAFLYAGEPVENIKLTGTVSIGSADSVATPVNDAQVSLIKNGITYQLIQDTSRSGYYIYSGSDLTVEPGDDFYLKINYSGTYVYSSTVVPQKPEGVSISKSTLTLTTPSGTPGSMSPQDTNSIKIKWSNSDSSLYYVVIKNLESDPEEISTGNFPGPGNINRTMTFPPSPTSEFIISRMNLTYYGKHEAILYKVNQEYADLYESRNQDSRNLNEPLTNIQNGLGVFSAFASDTVYFEVNSE